DRRRIDIAIISQKSEGAVIDSKRVADGHEENTSSVIGHRGAMVSYGTAPCATKVLEERAGRRQRSNAEAQGIIVRVSAAQLDDEIRIGRAGIDLRRRLRGQVANGDAVIKAGRHSN